MTSEERGNTAAWPLITSFLDRSCMATGWVRGGKLPGAEFRGSQLIRRECLFIRGTVNVEMTGGGERGRMTVCGKSS